MVSNWKTSNITDLLKPNGIKIGPFGSQLKKELFIQNGDYKVYGQENVYAQNFKIGDRYMTRSHFDKLRSCELLPGDFVMSTMGTVGKCAIVPAHITRGIMDSHLIRLRFDEKVIDKTYLLQLFSPDIQFLKDQTDKLSVGGIMDGLSVKIVSSLTVEYPSSVEEQKAIVNALSAADGMISSLEKLIAKKKAVKQGAMQELLTGKKRLPGFTGEWKQYKLDDLLKYEQPTKYIVQSTEYSEQGIPVLTAGKSLVLGYTVETAGIYENLPVIIFDDFVTSSKYIDFRFKVKSSAMKMLTLKNAEMNLKLIFELIQMIDFSPVDHQRHWISQYSQFKIKMPSDIKEQEAIASILSDMDNEIEALEQKLAKAHQVKQGMMQQLLVGTIRLV